MIIQSLKPLGEKNTVTLVIAYQGDNVVVTATITPINEKAEDQTRIAQIMGTVAEVDASLVEFLTANASVHVAFQTNIEAIGKQNADALIKAQNAKTDAPPTPKPKRSAKPIVTEEADSPPPAPTEPAAPATAEMDLNALIAEANAKK